MCLSRTKEHGIYLRLKSGNKTPAVYELFQVFVLHLNIYIGIRQKRVNVFKKQIELALHTVHLGFTKKSRHECRIHFQ